MGAGGGSEWLSGDDAAESALLCFFLLQRHEQHPLSGSTGSDGGGGGGGGGRGSSSDDRVRAAAVYISTALLGRPAPSSAVSASAASAASAASDAADAGHRSATVVPTASTLDLLSAMITTDAEGVLARFAVEAPVNTGGSLLLWAAEGTRSLPATVGGDGSASPRRGMLGRRDSDGDSDGPWRTAAASARCGCLALWKESDGRCVHRLHFGGSGGGGAALPLPPLLNRAAACELMVQLREAWGGLLLCLPNGGGGGGGAAEAAASSSSGGSSTTAAVAAAAGCEPFRGADPKRQVGRLIKAIRQMRR
jgi:hypothetical protein